MTAVLVTATAVAASMGLALLVGKVIARADACCPHPGAEVPDQVPAEWSS